MIRAQTRLHSFIEAVVNVSVGFCVSLMIWIWVVIPIWDLDGFTMSENLAVTAIFTVASIIRGFCLRRVFQWFQME